MADGGVSTIFVAGLSFDAQPRELENMMRFMPGYEGIKVTGPKGGGKGGAAVFVKFDNADDAVAAMTVLHNMPFDLQYPDQLMRVEIARSDMKTPAAAVPRSAVQAYQPAPPRHAHPVYNQPPPPVYAPTPVTYAAASGPPSKRARTEEDAGSVDTLALFGATEKGYTEGQLEDYFAQLPGFMCFKGNKRVGGGFVKFETPELAMSALGAAIESGLEAQIARTSMSSPAGDQAVGGYDSYGGSYHNDRGYAPAPHYSDPAPPPRGGGGGGGSKRGVRGGLHTAAKLGGAMVDTLILQGVTEKGWTSDTITDVFRNVPGFLTFKANPRVGGGFVKFADPEHAMDAIEVAANHGIEAQMARSSMK